MLDNFLTVLTIAVIIMDAIIVAIAVPILRFIERANAVIKLYDVFRVLLQKDFSEKELKVSYGKYELKFSNTNEASIEFEKLVNEALKYYDKLGWIAIADSSLKAQKDQLISIGSEVRTMRWKKQGI